MPVALSFAKRANLPVNVSSDVEMFFTVAVMFAFSPYVIADALRSVVESTRPSGNGLMVTSLLLPAMAIADLRSSSSARSM